jgi:hypothetical protein
VPDSIFAFFRSRVVVLWHPDSPGMHVPARLAWWRKRPSGFATPGDVLRYYRACDLVEAMRRV